MICRAWKGRGDFAIAALVLAGVACGDNIGATDGALGGDAAIPADADLLARDAPAMRADANDPGDAPDSGDDARAGDASTPAGVLQLSGDITPVHDPMLIATDTGFYLFSTGQGISVRTSDDLLQWTEKEQVFATKPSWITTTDPGNPNHLWAPHVAHFGGEYHLYYAASSFGSNTSCIGHATSPSLEPATWIDDGQAVICSSPTDNYNAIDPAVIVDGTGQTWLAFGSFWGGLKMIPLAIDGSRQGTDIYAIATRADHAIEAAFIVYRDDYYYLFESVGYCCRGVDSTYRVMVGRSPNITGPYVDRTGVPLLANGGTLLVEGDERWRGPGHNAVLITSTGDYNIYHAYDAEAGGVPTLRIATLDWAADGWPVSAGP